MDSTTRSAYPLRQRMIDDMRMRKLDPGTQEADIRAVLKLAAYLKRSSDTATVEELRSFQLHLVDTGTSRSKTSTFRLGSAPSFASTSGPQRSTQAMVIRGVSAFRCYGI